MGRILIFYMLKQGLGGFFYMKSEGRMKNFLKIINLAYPTSLLET